MFHILPLWPRSWRDHGSCLSPEGVSLPPSPRRTLWRENCGHCCCCCRCWCRSCGRWWWCAAYPRRSHQKAAAGARALLVFCNPDFGLNGVVTTWAPVSHACVWICGKILPPRKKQHAICYESDAANLTWYFHEKCAKIICTKTRTQSVIFKWFEYLHWNVKHPRRTTPFLEKEFRTFSKDFVLSCQTKQRLIKKEIQTRLLYLFLI